ncbi:MAG: lysoplasmalogenase [Proteobacteria bacterium]|nr:lysoplasmalogenase [Pseudomonadota bacterium]
MTTKKSYYTFAYFLAVALYFCFINKLSFPFNVLLKIIPILILIAFVYNIKLTISNPRQLIVALSLCLLGDLILTLPGELSIKLGIFFFSLAHFAYIGCFIKKGLVRKKRILVFLPFLFLILINFYFLFPYFSTLKLPVIGYILILTALMFFGLQLRESYITIGLGCFFFLVSDFNLALNEFVSPSERLRFLTLFFYYLSQLLLVAGLCNLNKAKWRILKKG